MSESVASGADADSTMAALEARLHTLYARPYLPRGDAERSLDLLRALLQVSPLAAPMCCFIAVCPM